MQREEKSERSRRQVLDAGLRLFSTQGYRATSVREIADAAHVSIGNVYHHFPDKEAIFRTLLDEYRSVTASDAFPLYKALRTGTFPENIERLGFAARDSVRQFRQYQALIFVDVIEFDGTHIREFYAELAQRFHDIVSREDGVTVSPAMREGVSPASALQVVTRLFLYYFQLEYLFGVPEPFGKDSVQIVNEISDILRHGISGAKLATEPADVVR